MSASIYDYQLAGKIRGMTGTGYEPSAREYDIRLDSNESFININEMLGEKIAAGVKAVSLNRYPDQLAAEAAGAFADYYGVESNLVTAGNGSDELISIISSCLLEKGDKLVTFTPDFSMYNFYAGLYEIDMVAIDKSADLTIDLEAAAEYCNANNVKAVIFSNPCSPTSIGIKRDKIIKFIESVRCLVIVDEAYMDFWDQSVLQLVTKYSNLIVLKTCSKCIGIAAIRLGFAVAGVTITNALRAVKSPYNTDTISQLIGAIVLREKDILTDIRRKILSSVTTLHQDFTEISKEFPIIEKVYDTKTNFIFVNTKKAEYIHQELLNRSIAIRRFGDYLRITCGTESENKALIAAVKEIVECG